MDPIKLDVRDGELAFDLGEGAKISLDVYRAYHSYGALVDQHAEDVAALDAAWCEWLQRNGFPAMSGWAAYTIAKAVGDRIADLKKKLAAPGSPRPGSPGSTGSPSAA